MTSRGQSETFQLPDYLRGRPTQAASPPPVEGHLNTLPYGDLEPRSFEYLILDHLRATQGWRDVQLYGDLGQEQDGIDLVDMNPSSGHPTCQVKRHRKFGPKALESAVERWLASRPFESDSFTLALSRRLSSASQKELARLRKKYPSAHLEVIHAGVLDRELRSHPEIVRRHFHSSWVKAFCDPSALSEFEHAEAHHEYLLTVGEESLHHERYRLLAAGVREQNLDDVILMADAHYELACEELLSKEFVVIEGPAGSGKSALLERVLRSRIKIASEDLDQALPIVIRARSAPDDLRTALRAEDNPLLGRSLHIDGLDEVPSARAEELVAQVKSLMSLGRVTSATLARRRRRHDEPGEPVYSVSELSDEESVELMSIVAGHDVPQHTIPSGAASKSVHLPLFAIIAGLLRSEHRAIPSSRAQFLVALARSEVGRAEQDESLWEDLSSFAAVAVSQAGRVSRSEVGNAPRIASLLGSRFIEEDAGALRFSLPLLEEFFAGQALINDPALVATALSSATQFEKWRGPLGIALALMSWTDVQRVITQAASSLPGAVWKLASSSFSGASNTEFAVPLPREGECEDRVRRSLNEVLHAIGSAREHTALLDGSGDVLPVGIVIADGRMSLAVWTPGSAHPPNKDTIHAGWSGPSNWSFERFQPA